MIWFTSTGLFVIGYGIFAASGWWKIPVIWGGVTLLAPVFAKIYFGGNRRD